MKKYGFTLIETVASIFILSILFSVGLSLSKLGNNIELDIKSKEYVYEIQNLLSYGKSVCREKNKYGKIVVKSSENQISFIEGWDNIEKTINLPKEFKIIAKNTSVLISNDGKMQQGNTITLFDKYGKGYEITIRVGVDLIGVKDDGAV